MENNKIDTLIKEKLQQRTLSPSASAWERLSNQLDVQKKPVKKNWLLYAGYAASIALLISVFFMMNKNSGEEPIVPNEIFVVNPIDTSKFEQKIFREPVEIEKAVVVVDESSDVNIIARKNDEVISQTKTKRNVIQNAAKNLIQGTIIASLTADKRGKNNEEIVFTKTKINVLKSVVKKSNKSNNSTIKINPDVLLYAVTHTQKEVQAYYAKHTINRSDVLKTIKKQLKKLNLKIDPATILAEVERTIDDDYFQNNFLEKVRLRVTDIAVAFADRNNE